MDPKTDQPNILTLTGVTLDDWKSFEDRFAESIMTGITEEEASTTLISSFVEPLPQSFMSLDNWPLDTTSRCHNCTLNVVGRPIPIPISIKEHYSGIEFGTKGIMCSFPCARRWIDIRYPDVNKRDCILTYLSWLHFIFTGRFKLNILAAPDHTVLKYYGGLLTEDMFKKHIASLEHVSRNAEDPVPINERIPTIMQVFRRSISKDQVRRQISSSEIDAVVSKSHVDYLTVDKNSIWANPSLNFVGISEDVKLSDVNFNDEDEEILKLIQPQAQPSIAAAPPAKVRKTRKSKT